MNQGTAPAPSNALSNVPSNVPSNAPSNALSNVPSNVPSNAPSNALSNVPWSSADIPPGTVRVVPERWGKDHWSVFAYVETCVVDRNGRLDNRRIQANLNRHPAHAGGRADGSQFDGAKYSIRLRNGESLPGPDYDEWDCLDDLEWFGLVENTGTGLNRRYRMTSL